MARLNRNQYLERCESLGKKIRNRNKFVPSHSFHVRSMVSVAIYRRREIERITRIGKHFKSSTENYIESVENATSYLYLVILKEFLVRVMGRASKETIDECNYLIANSPVIVCTSTCIAEAINTIAENDNNCPAHDIRNLQILAGLVE